MNALDIETESTFAHVTNALDMQSIALNVRPPTPATDHARTKIIVTLGPNCYTDAHITEAVLCPFF